MRVILASLGCGLVFGFGLQISGLAQPARVLGFLDIFGIWDPTLVFVLVAAVVVAGLGFAWARHRAAPIFAESFQWPMRTEIDRPLVIGAVLFGAGWGLVGLCPGPALVNLATLSPRVIVFGIAMALGMILQDRLSRRMPPVIEIKHAALATKADG